MATAVISSAESSYLEKIRVCEKDLIAVLGEKAFKEKITDTIPVICNSLFNYLSKDVSDEMSAKLSAILNPKEIDTMAKVCETMRKIIDLDILPKIKEEGPAYLNELEKSIYYMLKETNEEADKLDCKLAVERRDLEFLKRLKKLNRGWNKELLEKARYIVEYGINNKCNPIDIQKSEEIVKWIESEEPTWK